MSPRSATSDDYEIVFGVLAGEVAVATAGAKGPPDWIKVTPRGPITTRDDRRYHFDPEALAARFARDKIEVAVDTNHALALRATRGEPVEAIGYAAEIQARDDGTYARVNWIDRAAAAAAIRAHRYVSPTFFPDQSGRAVWLHSISLVAAPALSMPALLHALGQSDPSSPESFMKQIAKALGLKEDADEAACLAALAGRVEVKPLALALGLGANADAAACLAAADKAAGGLKPIARALSLAETADEAACLSAIATARSGGSEVIATLQANLRTTSEALGSLQKTVRDKDVSNLIDGALKGRRAVPAEREHLAALCASDEGLAAVRAMLSARTPGLQDSGLDGRRAESGEAVDPVTLAGKAQEHQRKAEAAGRMISIADAVAEIQGGASA